MKKVSNIDSIYEMTKNEKNFIYFQTLHINVKYKKKREIFRENLLDKYES